MLRVWLALERAVADPHGEALRRRGLQRLDRRIARHEGVGAADARDIQRAVVRDVRDTS